MGVTNEKSNAVKRVEGSLSGYDPDTFQKKVAVGLIDFTQGAAAGDATSTADLFYLPPGKRKLLKVVAVTSAFGASRVLDIGNAAYTKSDGSAGSAAAEAVAADIDVANAATTEKTPFLEFDSKGDGVKFLAAVAGGTIPAGATIKGFFLYV